MNLEMIPVEIVGLKSDLQAVLHVLRRAGCVHIDDLSELPEISARPLALDPDMLRQQEELSFLTARIGGLLDTLGCSHLAGIEAAPDKSFLEEARKGVETLMPAVQALTSRREELEAELASLPSYEATLRKLLPIIPDSAHDPGNRTVGVLVNREHTGILDNVGKRVLDMTAGQAEILASDVDATVRAMLIVFPEDFTNKVETLLGHEDISRLRLPSELGEGSPDAVLVSLHRRMADIPKEIDQIESDLSQLSAKWCQKLAVWRVILQDDMEATQVLPRFGETDMTFVLAGWVPMNDFEKMKDALDREIGETVFIKKLRLTPEMEKRAPVSLQNTRVVKPFESLTNLLALPR